MAKINKPVPNGPSKNPGQKSGGGRGNNPLKVKPVVQSKPTIKPKGK